MKLIYTLALSLLATASVQAATEPIYFYWMADGNSQYNAFFEYSGGTVANGVFTPTGLISYSIGTPFGVYTPTQHDPFFRFFTDTIYGPSFNLHGTVEPILFPGNIFNPGYQEFSGNNFDVNFQNNTEQVVAFENGETSVFSLNGTWTQVVPDAANSGLLFGVGLGALGLFHAAHRRKFAS